MAEVQVSKHYGGVYKVFSEFKIFQACRNLSQLKWAGQKPNKFHVKHDCNDISCKRESSQFMM